MIRLDAATVLLQWATGGLFFLWITTRKRQVGIGYGWLLRSVYGVMAVGAVVAGALTTPRPVRDTCAALVALAAAGALGVSIVRRKAGVRGERERQQSRASRVSAMLGDSPPDDDGTGIDAAADAGDEPPRGPAVEFPPVLDLAAPVLGLVGLLAAAFAADGPHTLAAFRNVAGAAFLGAVTDAMLLGHWYLVQPGLPRQPLKELLRWVMVTWPVEIVALLLPTGMVSVLSGDVDDGWNGTLGWFWVACAITTIALAFVTRAALRERAYSAVMAATGLLYLAILTAFGTDLVARAVLAS